MSIRLASRSTTSNRQPRQAKYSLVTGMWPIDWAAWTSVRAVTQAALRTQSTEYAGLLAYMLSDRLTLDGVKASPMSVRSWDHQLRQPILLAAGNVVVERAPIEGFVHTVTDLDTLGIDARQSVCRF